MVIKSLFSCHWSSSPFKMHLFLIYHFWCCRMFLIYSTIMPLSHLPKLSYCLIYVFFLFLLYKNQNGSLNNNYAMYYSTVDRKTQNKKKIIMIGSRFKMFWLEESYAKTVSCLWDRMAIYISWAEREWEKIGSWFSVTNAWIGFQCTYYNIIIGI